MVSWSITNIMICFTKNIDALSYSKLSRFVNVSHKIMVRIMDIIKQFISVVFVRKTIAQRGVSICGLTEGPCLIWCKSENCKIKSIRLIRAYICKPQTHVPLCLSRVRWELKFDEIYYIYWDTHHTHTHNWELIHFAVWYACVHSNPITNRIQFFAFLLPSFCPSPTLFVFCFLDPSENNWLSHSHTHTIPL